MRSSPFPWQKDGSTVLDSVIITLWNRMQFLVAMVITPSLSARSSFVARKGTMRTIAVESSEKSWKCVWKIFEGLQNVLLPMRFLIFLLRMGMFVVGRWCSVTSVSGRSTNLNKSKKRTYCACSRCGRGLLGHFSLLFLISCFFPLSGRQLDIGWIAVSQSH